MDNQSRREDEAEGARALAPGLILF